MKKQVH